MNKSFLPSSLIKNESFVGVSLYAWALFLLTTMIGLVFAFLAINRESVPLLIDWAPARWIIYPKPLATNSNPRVSIETEFCKKFDLAIVPDSPILRIRAFRDCTLELNGNHVPLGRTSKNWKQETSVSVGKFLREGENELTIRVANDHGPPALWLCLQSEAATLLVSDQSWQSSLEDATPCWAMFASTPTRYEKFDIDRTAERVFPSISVMWPRWLIFAGVSLTLVLLTDRWLNEKGKSEGERMRNWNWIVNGALLVSIATWTVLIVHNIQLMRGFIGFDSSDHLQYIEYICYHQSLPLADEGAQMYHPPLYYALCFLILKVMEVSPASWMGCHLILYFNLVLAICMILSTYGCMKIVFAGQPRCQLVGLLLAAFLPMHFYLYQFLNNEVLMSAVSVMISYAVLVVISSTSPRIRDFSWTGFALGAGLLAKITGVLFLPAVMVVTVCKLANQTGKNRISKGVLRLTLMLGILFSICGFHYIRTYQKFGTPVIGNTDIRVSKGWWQDPGYHFAGDFMRFGESLESPIFSLWYSVGDGLYSTLWADAVCGGTGRIDGRPPWFYDAMIAGLGLSIVISAGCLWGLLVAAWRFMHHPTLVWTYLLIVTTTVCGFLVWFIISVPHLSASKSSYAVPAIMPLCAFASLGLNSLISNRRWLQGSLYVFLGVWALNSVASFWVSPTDMFVRLQDVDNNQLPLASRIEFAEELAEKHPHNLLINRRLAVLYMIMKRPWKARSAIEEIPSPAVRHYFLAMFFAVESNEEEAFQEIQQATQLDPLDVQIAAAYVQAMNARKLKVGLPAVIDAARDAIRLEPFQMECHQILANAFRENGQESSALRREEFCNRVRRHYR